MPIIFPILATLLVVGIIYRWINSKKFNKKYGWIPKAPAHPIFGNILDFRKSTDTLQNLSKLLKGTDGLCLLNLMVQNMLIITNVEIANAILTSPTLLTKSKEYRFIQSWLGEGTLLAKGEKWKKSRKIITPAFHYSILRQFIPTFESNVDIMINLWEKELEKNSINIYPYVVMCTLDIICETSMGVTVNAQTNGHSDYILAVKGMCGIVYDRLFSFIQQSDFLYPLTSNYYKELKYIKTLHSHTTSVIKSKREEFNNLNKKRNVENGKEKEEEEVLGAKKRMAFLDLLLQSELDGEPLPDWYIRQEVDTLMFGGHDTTGSTISFALYSLAENPEVQMQAFEEQKTIFGDDRFRPATFEDVQNMKYLQLVVKETLRLFPPVPLYGRCSETDVEYKKGKLLPKNTALVINAFELHRDPKIFPDPEKFNPKRFETLDKSKYIFIPFSAGPRNCVGQKFAMLEMKTVLSKILRHYELLPAKPKHNVILVAESVLNSANGVSIRIKRRNWD